MSLAIIPARGGSKRIPRKNIRLFAGKPIIAYSIEAAKQSELFDHIVVSTDDSDIARVAQKWGAEIPFMRPQTLADDHVGTSPVVKHAIQWFNGQGQRVEYACCIYPTAPFLQPRYLREGFEKLSKSAKSFAFSVTRYSFPIQRAIRINGEGAVDPIYKEHVLSRSQDLEPAYHDAGQFYWGRSEAFLNDVTIFSPASLPIVLPSYEVHDVDTIEDWKHAELMFQAWRSAPQVAN